MCIFFCKSVMKGVIVKINLTEIELLMGGIGTTIINKQ